MGLNKELRKQFEDKFFAMCENLYPNTTVDGDEVDDCFKAIFIDDTHGDVDDAVNVAVMQWIEDEIMDEKDAPQLTEVEALKERKETLEIELLEIEEELNEIDIALGLEENKKSKKAKAAPKSKTPDTWNDLPKEKPKKVKKTPETWN